MALGTFLPVITSPLVPFMGVKASEDGTFLYLGGEGGLFEPGSTIAPVITFVDPLASETIDKNQTLTIDVTDAEGTTDIKLLCVSVRFKETGAEEVILRLGRFANSYSSSQLSNITNGFRLILSRASGWPSTPTLQVDVVDGGGQVS